MSPITARSRQAGVLDAFAANMQKPGSRKRHLHSHRTGVVRQATTTPAIIKPKACSLRSPDPGGQICSIRVTIFRNNSPTGFAWGYNGSGPTQLALAILNRLLRSENRKEGARGSLISAF